ncbi:hypothetical protein CEXT_788161 [Caerostris extrusa]|uniref:Uncharacterized protein n=1 Tax=Caerostris extrusa TaxID=172846 RepID=A0AAV4S7C0_CAEEX|nr:hypothetical protein CEXT_788161 [Caerostris extrusa]
MNLPCYLEKCYTCDSKSVEINEVYTQEEARSDSAEVSRSGRGGSLMRGKKHGSSKRYLVHVQTHTQESSGSTPSAHVTIMDAPQRNNPDLNIGLTDYWLN